MKIFYRHLTALSLALLLPAIALGDAKSDAYEFAKQGIEAAKKKESQVAAKKKNEMRKLPHGVRNDIPMTFMILRDGKAIFDGDVEELVATKDDYIREYIS